MTDCIFCKIVAGEMPAEVLYRDEQVTAFRDIRPVAPTHVLIVPNRHMASLNEASYEDEALLGRILFTAKKIAEMEGIQESGYRLIVNTGPDANQVVFHLHLHVIGGQHVRYPMG